MVKAPQKQVKKDPPACECGGELKWVKRANNNCFYYSCAKCSNYYTKRLIKKVFNIS